MESTELVIKRQIEEIMHIRNESIGKYQEVLNGLDSIESNLETIGEYLFPVDRWHLKDIKDFAKELDKRLWKYSFDKLGVFTVMNHNGIKKLRGEIEEKAPVFTAENVQATIEKMYDNRKDYFAEGIVDTFKNLSRFHKTNTNDKFKIPNKCVISYMVETDWNSGLRLRYNNENYISDVQRTFCVLDQKEFDGRQTICEINARLKNKEVYDNEYIELKGYKNGNVHLRFKRIDLLDKANQLIAEHYSNSLK